MRLGAAFSTKRQMAERIINRTSELVNGARPKSEATPASVHSQCASGFFGTSLASLLNSQGVDCAIVAGRHERERLRAATAAVQHGYIPIFRCVRGMRRPTSNASRSQPLRPAGQVRGRADHTGEPRGRRCDIWTVNRRGAPLRRCQSWPPLTVLGTSIDADARTAPQLLRRPPPPAPRSRRGEPSPLPVRPASVSVRILPVVQSEGFTPPGGGS